MKRLSVFLVIAFFCLSCSGHDIGSLEEDLQTLMANYNAVGVSVVVVKKNKVCYSHSFGYNPDYSDLSLRNPIADDGIYWIASVSKTFVSAAVMQLVEKKKLELDNDINNYLGFMVRNPRYPDVPITVRMLLCHRSSINDSQYDWTLKMMDFQTNSKYAECYNDYEPGTKYEYCNLNYNLLGAIIENVTGQRFDEYIESNICAPLELDASFNLTNIDSTRLVKALLYDKEKKAFVIDESIYNYRFVSNRLKNYKLGRSTASFSPAGGMKITVKDLAKWMRVHMNYGRYNGHRFLKRKTEKEMWRPQGKDRYYGFAFSQYRKIIDNVNLLGMTGGSHGIHSAMFFNPKKKYGFVVICNGCTSKSANGAEMNYEIVRILYNYLVK